MSTEQKPTFQTHGAKNKIVVINSQVISSDANTSPEIHIMRSNNSQDNMDQLPMKVHPHTETSTSVYCQPEIMVGSSCDDKFANLKYEEYQHSYCWNDFFVKHSPVQLVPSNHPVPSMMAAISPTVVSIKQKHHLELIESAMTVPLNKSDDEKRKDNLDCPICGRKFVYQLNFAKHLAAAGCCQPPSKKSRQDSVSNQAFKSNTLPRASRSKKVIRSNSTKKRQTIPSVITNQQQDCQLADFDVLTEFRENSLIMANSNEFLTTPSFISLMTATTSEFRLERQETTLYYCDFCQMQYNERQIFQRHRLAHALVIQLTHTLQLSLRNGSHQRLNDMNSVVQGWLGEQFRINFNDKNWLKQAVGEVELILNCSNMDVDIRQRHGLSDDKDFQNVLDLLATRELNPLSTPEPEAHSTELSAACTSFSCDSSPIESDSLCDVLNSFADFPVAVELNSSKDSNLVDPLSTLSDEVLRNIMSTEASPNYVSGMDQPYDVNSDDSLFVNLDAVEKQMADLLKPYQFTCSECGRCFSQPELVFEHAFFDHPVDNNRLRREITEPSTKEMNVNGGTISESLPLTDIGELLTCSLNQSNQ